jgi:hypothetical protein
MSALSPTIYTFTGKAPLFLLSMHSTAQSYTKSSHMQCLKARFLRTNSEEDGPSPQVWIREHMVQARLSVLQNWGNWITEKWDIDKACSLPSLREMGTWELEAWF